MFNAVPGLGQRDKRGAPGHWIALGRSAPRWPAAIRDAVLDVATRRVDRAVWHFSQGSTLDFSAAAESPPSSPCARDGAGHVLTVHYMRSRHGDAVAVSGWVPTSG
jgi:hypothetical protein